jgi:hypothetical protein
VKKVITEAGRKSMSEAQNQRTDKKYGTTYLFRSELGEEFVGTVYELRDKIQGALTTLVKHLKGKETSGSGGCN